MKTLKRWLLALGVLLVMAVLLGLLCYLFARPWYYRLFYPWDRYTGTVRVEVDGDAADFTVEKLEFLKPVRVSRQRAGSAYVSMHAGFHGVYGFLVRIDGVEQPIKLTSLKWNWQVIHYEARISVDREARTVTCTAIVRETDDRGVFFERTVEETASLADEELSFPVSW